MSPQASTSIRGPPTRFAVALYPGFQALDVFGPLDILNMLSKIRPLSLQVLSATLDPVLTQTSSSGHSTGQSVVPTRTYADSVDDTEVLLVPGGFGSRDPANVAPVVEYVRAAYPRLRYLLTVCTGSAVVATSGVLDGRRATSNKIAWEWATAQGPRVNWVRQARWVTDGNIWTSSGVSAGIDMMYAFVADQYGEDIAQTLADRAEYIRNTDPDFDPFAEKAENRAAK
ncbi:class I glutamine amidotransferase-like protein [Daldinia vernicosa]|uniref:class I glutamine amidotransferase-like protein n=1 Tax=Daldinia vernicosa TaxID=114800 RepID=UPI0020081975|nr:class I glutamine amidotransferase-like protein [Daldinia vernicosa]KAI0849998.1 class I glutamine amidotransferase-like protein [Daldinia vernicosa]